MLIFFIHKRGCNHEVGAGLVVCNWNVVYLCNPQQGLYIRIMRLGSQRIGKEDHKIDLSLNNLRSDLLVSS